MAEFGMKTSTTVDWYTPSTTPDYNAYAAPSGYGGASSGYGGAVGGSMGGPSGGAGGFEDEPPLLEELGIDIPGILLKTRAVLLLRLGSKYLDDLDMGGALMYIFGLAALHLLLGKLHFGVILGWSVVHAVVLWFLINQLAGGDSTNDGKGMPLYKCCCIFGYCLLPLLVHSGAALLIPKHSRLVSVALAGACALWSAAVATKIAVRRCPPLEDLSLLVFCPCALSYGAFALLATY